MDKIKNHDNEYHREGCKHYRPNPEPNKKLKPCCKNNILCERFIGFFIKNNNLSIKILFIKRPRPLAEFK